MTHARLFAFLGVIVAQRLVELALSRRNTRIVATRGAVEAGAGHYPLIVCVHVLFLLCFAGEVITRGTQPGAAWPLWLSLWIAAQALRYSAIRALGDRWNTRILVVPGEAPVAIGPYRFLKHPNYVAVVVELIAAPLLFGAWRTALFIGVLNAAVLAVRIRTENAALRDAGRRPV